MVDRSLHEKFQLARKLPPAILLLFRTGGAQSGGGGRLDELKLMLNQPSLSGSGSELGNIVRFNLFGWLSNLNVSLNADLLTSRNHPLTHKPAAN